MLQTTRNLQFWGANRPPQKSTAKIRLQILFLHNLIGQQFGFTLVASEKRAESFGCNKKKESERKGPITHRIKPAPMQYAKTEIA